VGRTGALYDYMNVGVTPDILTSAKALGNGYPIGAMLTTNEIGQHLSVGTHGTTYGGNPLATTVALNVIEQINQPAFLARVREASAKIFANLEKLAVDYPQLFTKPRGKGLLIGLPMADANTGRAKDYTKTAEKLGLMLLIAGPDVVRLAPALVVSDEQIAQADGIMRAAADGTGATALVPDGPEVGFPIWMDAGDSAVTIGLIPDFTVANNADLPKLFQVPLNGGTLQRYSCNRGEQFLFAAGDGERVVWLDGTAADTDLVTRTRPARRC
jgi:hypothetical protein